MNNLIKELIDAKKDSDRANKRLKAAKEAVRAKLSPEINKIIGDIPHALLGDITQFTVNRVDTEKLNKLKDIYCIDNNWHHVGSWFCIDVVKESGRYFFNNKLGVSILIPISILKQWKEVVA